MNTSEASADPRPALAPGSKPEGRLLLEARGITCSMSRRGDCYDNAAMESWFGTLKTELGEKFETHAEGKRQLFEYIEVFYNQKRRHSSLGYVSPGDFERANRNSLKAGMLSLSTACQSPRTPQHPHLPERSDPPTSRSTTTSRGGPRSRSPSPHRVRRRPRAPS